MPNIPELFAKNVFTNTLMRKALPPDAYQALRNTITSGEKLDPAVADTVAEAMKDWAIARGATHYTHWFQPMTGITAEKHDSFIEPDGEDRVIMQFTGRNLIQGEPDASSFPSGGLRATFEARGYTAWDPTSPAFIKENTLCIPTAYYSYGGEVLDKKTPLLRSMEALNKQALRVLRCFGNEAKNVTATVGAEQEYFLIDYAHYNARDDLKITGRTLFGARPPKGQELEDHYFGAIRPRVKAFMAELDEELWKLGILSKTEHNEVAPAQHEIAPIFTTANMACDQNQLMMELIKKIAVRHGMAALLHEKPFAGVNGSGKHNNWSLQTNTGENLLAPGKTPGQNFQFLIFLTAIIKAVDLYADLLRVSVATAGNDLRLGSGEAPPAVMSIFLGTQLTEVLESIAAGKLYDTPKQDSLDGGAAVLPALPRDTSDRNRTSPFAFTGNKFEFRAPGSAQSISCTNMLLNTAVAEVLSQVADRLETAADFTAELNKLIAETYNTHKRVVFNGNCYSGEWRAEAAARGLPNRATTPEALPRYADAKHVELLSRHGVLTQAEIGSRTKVLLENYIKVKRIEAETMLHMARREILPAASAFSAELAQAALQKFELSQAAKHAELFILYEGALCEEISKKTTALYEQLTALEDHLACAANINCTEHAAQFIGTTVAEEMARIRENVDYLESVIAAKAWPYPTYVDLLFRL